MTDADLARELRAVEAAAAKLAHRLEHVDAAPVWPAEVRDQLRDLASHTGRLEREARWSRRP